MSRRFIVVVLLAMSVLPVFAQSATVTRAVGKVEFMAPGGQWAVVREGDRLPMGATISTGFRSSAVLLVGRTEITVLALTRMAVEELVEAQSSTKTTIALRTGKVRADVRSTEGKTMDFSLRSPVSTAAVRGTSFVFDGYRLDVLEGVVDFFNALGEMQRVGAGFGSSTTGDSPPSYPEDDKAAGLGVDADPSGGAGGGGAGASYTGNLAVTIVGPEAE